MRLLVCGDRNWDKPRMIETILDGFYARYGVDLVIIEGCARGADSVACNYLTQITHEHYPADWDAHGKGAGPIRNRKMLADGKPDLVLAFHDEIEKSKGTKDMVNIATAAALPVYVIARQYPF